MGIGLEPGGAHSFLYGRFADRILYASKFIMMTSISTTGLID